MIIKAFTSDQHWDHFGIIKHCNRPFSSVEEMNNTLINNYNSLIGKDDTVLWVGDVSLKGAEYTKTVLKQLNGNKILVVGNHDRSPAVMSGAGFDLVMEECFLTIAGKSVRVKHFPYFNWEPKGTERDDRYKEKRPPKVDGQFLIHGHSHSKNKKYGNMIHVGVDAWNYFPALYSDVEKLITI